jgi:site-specific recombinase XerC
LAGIGEYVQLGFGDERFFQGNWAECHYRVRRLLGVRDAAIISLLYGYGLRRVELLALKSDAYIKEENELIVRGKGNKQRAVPVGNAVPALADWLSIRGSKAGPLFLRAG